MVAAVLAFIARQNPMTADVAWALLAEMRASQAAAPPRYPLLQTVRITADRVLAYEVIKNRCALHGNPGGIVREQMEHLMAAWFEVDYDCVPGTSSHGASGNLPSGRSRNANRLFDMICVRGWPRCHEAGTALDTWLVRGGQWAYWHINAMGRTLLCRLAAAALKCEDAETAHLATKLGHYLSFAAAARGTSGHLPYTLGDLLKAIAEVPDAGLRRNGSADAYLKRFDTAISALLEAWVLTQVIWPLPRHLDDGPVMLGTLDEWLGWQIQVAVPVWPVEFHDEPAIDRVR
jgi:hypothetical protein